MNRKTKKPQKFDPFINPNPENATGIYDAIRPLDRVALEMEEKWGADRLPDLVSPATAARFASAQKKLNAAIDADDLELVIKKAAALIRGWKALNEEATAAGRKPMEPVAWCWRDDEGRSHAFLKENADALAYAKKNPNTATWTMAEIIRVAKAFDEKTKNIGTEAKITFPGAKIVSIGGKLNDEIPF